MMSRKTVRRIMVGVGAAVALGLTPLATGTALARPGPLVDNVGNPPGVQSALAPVNGNGGDHGVRTAAAPVIDNGGRPG